MQEQKGENMQEQKSSGSCLGTLFEWLIILFIAGLIGYWLEPDFRQMVHDLYKQPHKVRKIGEVLDNFTYYAGETVTIQGVARRNFLFENIYHVSDDSADIMVITDNTPPAEETVVRVTGRVTRNRLGAPVIDEEKRIVVQSSRNSSEQNTSNPDW